MPIDRDAALKRAEKLLRQGKLDGAIEEYVRLVEDQPRDWNSLNALGDLYLRGGDADRAVVQFTKVADHLFADGVLPKAAALYKKALKAKGDHEHTLQQLAEIAARQGLLADAKAYLRQLADLRRLRGDERGAAESLIRLGWLEEADADAGPPAAGAARDSGDSRQAAALLRTAAADFEKQGRRQEALDLLLSLARMELALEEEHQARATLTRVLTSEPGRRGDVMTIALDLARDGRLESAFGCMDVVTDAALLDGDWDHAVDGLQTFVRAVPYVPALVKLVELCVDAGLDAPLCDAQARLADAYLQEGRGAEARVISEDLLDHDPGSEDHARRLVRALELLGIGDASRLVEERLSGRTAPVDLSDGFDAEGPEASEAPLGIEVPMEMPTEIDLSEAVADIRASQAEAAPAETAGDPYARGLECLRAGRLGQGIAALEAAARDPRTRFKAAAELGRLHVGRGELQAGIDWFERAAEASCAAPEEGLAVLYDLADALDRFGETARALALLIELDADSGGYRDVRARIEQLARAQAWIHLR